MLPPFSQKRMPALHFGSGRRLLIPELLRSFGTRVVVITGRSSLQQNDAWADLAERLTTAGCQLQRQFIDGEPSPGAIDAIVAATREEGVDAVLAIGGGSVLDAGKAVAAMLRHEGSVSDYLEGVGHRKPQGKRLPLIAVPTTSGTGSEATANSVLSEVGPEGYKKSLRHDNFIPDIAIVDPELTIGCPADLTAACGMDAYSQLIEAYLSNKATPLTDLLAVSGIQAMQRSLRRALAVPDDLAARSDLAYGSFLSGVVLSNAGLGVVHGLAGAIGGLFAIPHGVVCSALLVAANRVTLRELTGAGGEYHPALAKYARLGRLIANNSTADDGAAAQHFLGHLELLVTETGLAGLGEFGVTVADLDRIAARAGSKNNPVELATENLVEVLAESL